MKNQTPQVFDSDQLAPNSIEAEAAVLGAVLMNEGTLIEVQTLEADDFFLMRHQTIWTAIRDLQARGEPIDVLVLANELEQMGQLTHVGGPAYLIGLVNKTPAALNVAAYGRIVEDMAQRRRLLDTAGTLTSLAHSDERDMDAVLSEADNAYQEATRRRAARALVDWGTVAIEAITDIEDAAAGRRPEDRLRTYWEPFDIAYGGLQLGTYNLLAGRTNEGKTQTALNLVVRALHGGVRVMVISQEVTPKMLMHRMGSLIARTSATGLIRARQPAPQAMQELRDAYGQIADWGGSGQFVGHYGRFSIDQVESMIIRAAYQHGTQLVILDTVNKLKFEGDQRYWGMTDASQRLEAVTKAQGVCTIGLAQLNRDAARNGEGRPTLHTLKESGALEEDSDNVWAIWWPWKHWSEDRRLAEPAGEFVAHLLHLKAREGGQGADLDLLWSPEQGMALLTAEEHKIDLDERSGWKDAAK